MSRSYPIVSARARRAAALLMTMSALAACGAGSGDLRLVGGSGTGAGDTTRPSVVSTSPTPGATNVPTNAAISVTFSEQVDSASVTNAAFTLSSGSGTITVNGAIATLTPTTPLTPNSQITATVSTAVRDRAGNALATPVSWSFTTAP